MTYTYTYILAGMLAAGLAFLGNQRILSLFGSKGISQVTPLFEELLKTGLAVTLGASVLGTHLVFGLIEGAYDYGTAPRGRNWAAIVSLISHGIFGLVTANVLGILGFFPAVAVSGALHTSWNILIVTLAEGRQKRKLY